MAKDVRLTDLLEDRTVSLPVFFKLALQLAGKIEEARSNRPGFIPLYPGDIWVNPETMYILRWDPRPPASISAADPETWIYIAPEQTGKLNREVDWRADFYILGLLFFRMLTGKYPYDAEGKSEWMYAHLAKPPIAAETHKPHIPRSLSMMLDKLLSKSVEVRYQTVKGLQMDLLHCLHEYDRTGNNNAFVMGAEDRTNSFHIPDRFYGREQEQSLIRDIFQWTTLGSTQMICVSGPSGIGKTALVQEALQRIAHSEAYSISGKFELHQDSPMSPLIQAFRELVKQLLKEDESSLTQWRSSITHSLGSNGAVIAEVIPEIDRIIGASQPVELLPPEESKKRFQLTFRRFIQVFCQQKHPLVLFLDDLQWVDAASWRMIRSIMTDPQSQSLLLIGVFRDVENPYAYPFSEELELIENSGVNVHFLPVDPLSPDELNLMVADALSIDEQTADDITKTLVQLTGGNPLLFRQLLHTSLLEQIIRYDDHADKWMWTPDSMDRMDDYVDSDKLMSYIVLSIHRLPPQSRKAMMEASCLGSEFEVRQLSALRQESTAQTLETLKSAMLQKMISFIEEKDSSDTPRVQQRLCFTHDRVREAAYGLLDESARSSIHWQAGHILLTLGDTNLIESRPFEIVNHLNAGASCAVTNEEKDNLLHNNARAGVKAKSATAYEAALLYFQTASDQIREVHWRQEFDFCFDLSLDLLECEYINNQLVSSEGKMTALLQRARNASERARIHQLKITHLLQADKYREGIELGIKCLQDLGLRIPRKLGKIAVVMELLMTRKLMSRHVGKLSGLPAVSRAEKRAALNVLMLISSAAYLDDRELSLVLICKFVRISLRYGNAPSSAIAFVNFGASLCMSLFDCKMGNLVMKEGLKLAEMNNHPSVLCRIHLAYGAAGFLMNEGKKDFNDSLGKSIENGLEAGDYVFTGHAVSTHILNLYLCGKLDQIKSIVPQYRELLLETQNQYLLIYMNIISQWADRLRESVQQPSPERDKPDLIQSIEHSGMNELLMFQYHCCQLQERYLFGNYDAALWNIEKAIEYEKHSLHFFQQSEYYFYAGLTLASIWHTFSTVERRIRHKKWKECLQKLERWARACPDFMLHKVHLLTAEDSRIQGKHNAAAFLYDEAIKKAHDHGYVLHEAIANECAGRYYLSQSRVTIARGYLAEAVVKYQECGATGKVGALMKQYPHLIEGSFQSLPDYSFAISEVAASPKSNGDIESFDISILQEAFQFMADEADQHKLIGNLMRVLLENAGAQQGCLIVENANRYYVEVIIGKDGQTARERFPIESCDGICLPAVQYTIHSMESVLLENAAAAGPFTQDPYVAAHQTKSLLCLPLPLHNRLSGVLYLENNLLPGAFVHNQFDMLRMLATQTMFLLKLFPHDHGLTASHNERIEHASGDTPLDPLTVRELEVLHLMSLGLSNNEIAKSLTLAVGTVKLHINRIFNKLNVTRRTKAVFEAKRMNLLAENKS